MSIRLRLALGYAGVFAFLSMLLFPVIYFTVEKELLEGADSSLVSPSQQLLSSLQGYPKSLANAEGGWSMAGNSQPAGDRRLSLDLEPVRLSWTAGRGAGLQWPARGPLLPVERRRHACA